MNIDYTKVTHEELLEQFKNRMLSDPRFKNISAASLYQIYMEMMAGTFDMVHFYLGRTAEEMYLDSARLDSSIIKLSKNLGYNPKRAIPARAEIAVKITGPLPESINAGYKIWFNNETLKLSFNNYSYKLDRCYSYEFTQDDIIGGRNNSQWSKTIYFSVDNEDSDGYTTLSTSELNRIKVIQCDIKTKEIYAVSHLSNLGKSYQFYDIDDIDFSNYYGIRDQYAVDRYGKYTPETSWCKIGIGLNKTDAFSKDKLCDIEVENIYCNSKVKALNDKLANPVKLNVCRVESLQDKTVRITFGDGSLVNNGFNTQDEILYVQYVTTAGYAANTPNVMNNAMQCGSSIVATGPGRNIDVTKNISFILNSDIYGGENFESQISMKNNAAVYFASRGQLINKKDFNAYFSSISEPITTKAAIAWHMNEVLSKLNADADNKVKNAASNTKNLIFYSVVGDLYTSLSDKKFAPQMLYTADDDVIASTTLYANADLFAVHLSDLADSAKSESNAKNKFLSQKYNKEDPFYLNTSRIIDAIDDRLPFGVMPVSLPPIVQYFDLVGTVDVSRTTNISDYKDDIENTIYTWLRDNQNFNNKIYKSDIVKLFYDNAFTKAVNVDLTPSSMIYSPNEEYTYTNTTTSNTNDANKAYILQTAGGSSGYYNIVVIPATDDNGRHLSVEYINSLESIGFRFGTNSGTEKFVSISNVEELSDGRLKLTLNGYGFSTSHDASATTLVLSVKTSDVIYSDTATSNSTIENAINGLTTTSKTYATPVPLPYNVSTSMPTASTSKVTHKLSYERKGNDNRDAKSLTELGFNLNYANSLNDVTTYTSNYKACKFAICDSILDDNNNIVNFSLPHEIAVVRLMVEYRNSRA